MGITVVCILGRASSVPLAKPAKRERNASKRRDKSFTPIIMRFFEVSIVDYDRQLLDSFCPKSANTESRRARTKKGLLSCVPEVFTNQPVDVDSIHNHKIIWCRANSCWLSVLGRQQCESFLPGHWFQWLSFFQTNYEQWAGGFDDGGKWVSSLVRQEGLFDYAVFNTTTTSSIEIWRDHA